MDMDKEYWDEVIGSAKGSAMLEEAIGLLKRVEDMMRAYGSVPEDFYECLDQAREEIAFAKSGLDGMTVYDDEWE